MQLRQPRNMKIISSFPYSVLLQHSFSQGIPSFCIWDWLPWLCFTREPSPSSFSFPLASWKTFHLQFRKYPVAELSHMWCVCQKSVSVSVTANKRDTDISKKQSLPPEVEVGVTTSPSPSHILQADDIHYHTNTPGHVNGEHKQL